MCHRHSDVISWGDHSINDHSLMDIKCYCDCGYDGHYNDDNDAAAAASAAASDDDDQAHNI